MKRTLRHLALPSLALTLALGLSACGGDSTMTGSDGSMNHGSSGSTSSAPGPSTPATGTPAAGAHNDADVAFATDMIPHHRQAVMMADMAATQSSDASVKELAAGIKVAQGPEITEMSGWLTGWGAPVPNATGMDHSMGGGMGGENMNGMMSDQDMTKMGAMSGTDFDEAFLTGMTAHHEGAVKMARQELADGQNAEAKKLAQAIIDSQTAEITTMKDLLAKI